MSGWRLGLFKVAYREMLRWWGEVGADVLTFALVSVGEEEVVEFRV